MPLCSCSSLCIRLQVLHERPVQWYLNVLIYWMLFFFNFFFYEAWPWNTQNILCAVNVSVLILKYGYKCSLVEQCFGIIFILQCNGSRLHQATVIEHLACFLKQWNAGAILHIALTPTVRLGTCSQLRLAFLYVSVRGVECWLDAGVMLFFLVSANARKRPKPTK